MLDQGCLLARSRRSRFSPMFVLDTGSPIRCRVGSPSPRTPLSPSVHTKDWQVINLPPKRMVHQARPCHVCLQERQEKGEKLRTTTLTDSLIACLPRACSETGERRRRALLQPARRRHAGPAQPPRELPGDPGREVVGAQVDPRQVVRGRTPGGTRAPRGNRRRAGAPIGASAARSGPRRGSAPGTRRTCSAPARVRLGSAAGAAESAIRRRVLAFSFFLPFFVCFGMQYSDN
jgi:hypothetical protein